MLLHQQNKADKIFIVQEIKVSQFQQLQMLCQRTLSSDTTEDSSYNYKNLNNICNFFIYLNVFII